ncbi:hypothetical protein [Flavobacterium yafengii]|uniref:hypothetical protein n=1 Tax=Flavobacterium yafengii TaxID=3041253 RepID=UPI0024A92DCE|nr:hypothetical protein [Flavobacterium yafengii]MDI6047026.1 hypothetical protein [Flavobacterium yafengii]
MHSDYSNIICIHPKDNTTDFLKPLGEIFHVNYLIVEDNEEAHAEILLLIESFTEKSLVVFLGHGHTYGLASSNTESFTTQVFIDITKANKLFTNHDVLLLACRSSEFIGNINSVYNSIVGFGNILSSLDEVSNEALYETGFYRNLEQLDIDYFNKSYIDAISKSFMLVFENKIKFNQISSYISYFLNKSINLILRQMNKENRVEVARLLFEFRNEMVLK